MNISNLIMKDMFGELVYEPTTKDGRMRVTFHGCLITVLGDVKKSPNTPTKVEKSPRRLLIDYGDHTETFDVISEVEVRHTKTGSMGLKMSSTGCVRKGQLNWTAFDA